MSETFILFICIVIGFISLGVAYQLVTYKEEEDIISNFDNALQAIYDHVGFVEDWVVYPIDDKTSYLWYIVEGVDHSEVHYAKEKNDFSTGEFYGDVIYKQRFYEKHVYEGEKYTMIFCDPNVDGIKWFRIFDNKKRIDV